MDIRHNSQRKKLLQTEMKSLSSESNQRTSPPPPTPTPSPARESNQRTPPPPPLSLPQPRLNTLTSDDQMVIVQPTSPPPLPILPLPTPQTTMRSAILNSPNYSTSLTNSSSSLLKSLPPPKVPMNRLSLMKTHSSPTVAASAAAAAAASPTVETKATILSNLTNLLLSSQRRKSSNPKRRPSSPSSMAPSPLLPITNQMSISPPANLETKRKAAASQLETERSSNFLKTNLNKVKKRNPSNRNTICSTNFRNNFNEFSTEQFNSSLSSYSSYFNHYSQYPFRPVTYPPTIITHRYEYHVPRRIVYMPNQQANQQANQNFDPIHTQYIPYAPNAPVPPNQSPNGISSMQQQQQQVSRSMYPTETNYPYYPQYCPPNPSR